MKQVIYSDIIQFDTDDENPIITLKGGVGKTLTIPSIRMINELVALGQPTQQLTSITTSYQQRYYPPIVRQTNAFTMTTPQRITYTGATRNFRIQLNSTFNLTQAYVGDYVIQTYITVNGYFKSGGISEITREDLAGDTNPAGKFYSTKINLITTLVSGDFIDILIKKDTGAPDTITDYYTAFIITEF